MTRQGCIISMSEQIIKQPNGLYGLWSTIVDNFVLINATREELIAYRVEKSIKEIAESIDKALVELNAIPPVKRNFTLTWDEALKCVRELHGEKELTNLLKDFSKLHEFVSDSATHET